MTYADFKSKVRKAYPGFKITFSSNGAQHMAVLGELTLYMNAGGEAVYGMIDGISIGRAIGID